MRGLIDIAAATAGSRSLFESGAPVLAMVSGGADSTALLRLLASGALGERSVSVLHVNHLLRGEAADSDQAAVEALCGELGIACRVVRYDVGAYAAEAGLNLEDAGRRVRYRFADEELDALCAASGVDARRGRIATAHTFDDRAETLLMRLAQGSGAGGLVSPPYRRGRLVRPLLDCTRAEVIAYLEGLGQDWCEDASNTDVSRTRARVRAELVPLLRDINPRFDEALARTVTVLSDEDELLAGMASAFAGDFASASADEVRFERSRMATLSRAMMRRAVRAALFDTFPDATRLEFDHVEAVCDGMGVDGFARDLPGGLRAFDEYGTLIISRRQDEAEPMAPSLLTIPGTVDLGSAGTLTATAASPDDVDDDPFTAFVDADRLRGALTVDSPRPGDRMRPLGMEGSRKLQDVLTDAKVPRRRRAATPVVRDGECIVWLSGLRMSEEYRVGPGTVRAVRLGWTGPRTGEDHE
ncbi:MAG: tRNA lysidine(34) synthetase TilS [Coriobacteriia bacterium]|nr:tRNA lysidine(34) synthetase TilS [Coriobacteriia bacterium]